MNPKKTLLLASILGAAAVALGAFGAHSLKAVVSPDRVAIFDTGVRYQFYHTFALFISAILLPSTNFSKFLTIANNLFIAGIVLFSGSLYLLACRDLLGIGDWTPILGPMTPIGGLCFILAWLFLGIGIWRSR